MFNNTKVTLNIKFRKINKILQNKLLFFFLVNILLGFFILSQIHSNKFYLFFLLIVSNGYLYDSFGKKIYTFHFFLSLFFWIGFWIKLVLLSLDIYLDLSIDSDYFVNKITDTKNYEVVNQSLLVSAMGILGFYFSLHVQKIFFPLNKKETYLNYHGNFVFINNFIKKNIKKLIIIFLLLVLFCFILNVFFQIYQKGIIPNSNINFFLSSFFKLLVIFGFSLFSSILIFHTYYKKDFSFIVVLISLLENFITSVGMLSRGMFINSLAIIFGLIKHLNLNDKKIFTKKILVIIFIAVILFITSIKLSLVFRTNIYFNNFKTIYAPINDKESNNSFLVNSIIQVNKISLEILILLKNRFPGFEEVFYVSKKNNILNFELLKKSFDERFDSANLTFYEKIIKNSNYQDHQSENTNIYFINVPGIVAFLYYSGSLIFVLVSSFIIGLAISYIEKIVLNFFYNNLILASVVSQTLAYRLINFGYLPTNTYQLILSLFLNLLLIYSMYEFIKFKKNK